MKKSLLALAVLGAFAASAQAQTNVSIGGVIQANVKSYKISSTARVVNNELRIDDDYTSRFWLTGTEDLGGGLSALFYIENRFNTDQTAAAGVGNGLANGDTFLGLKGGFGQVTLGKHSMMSVQGLTTEILTGSGVTAMPTSMFATYSVLNQNIGYLDVTRRLNSVMYRSPNMSGFSGSLGLSTASAGPEGVAPGALYNDGREIYLQGGYANGPLALSLAYRNQEVEGRTGTDDTQLRFSGTYKFGAFKVGLQADRSVREAVAAGVQVGGDMKRTAWSIPASYVFGNNTILGSITRAGDTSNVAGENGAKMYTLGWDHALSKRTNVGVFYSRLDNKAAGIYQPFLAGTSATGSGLAAGETASTFAVGVKHTF